GAGGAAPANGPAAGCCMGCCATPSAGRASTPSATVTRTRFIERHLRVEGANNISSRRPVGESRAWTAFFCPHAAHCTPPGGEMRFTQAFMIAFVAVTTPAAAQQRARPNPRLEQYQREAAADVDGRAQVTQQMGDQVFSLRQ